jgi:lipoprotein NlpD
VSGRAALALLPLALGLACAHRGRNEPPLHPPEPAGVFYVVRAGDSLLALAARQGVPLEDLAEINGLAPGERLTEGQVIFLLAPAAGPGGGPVSPEILPPTVLDDAAPAQPAGAGFLRWPLDEVQVSSRYGRRWGRLHEGIDLAAPLGTPVRAARAGAVIYAGSTLRGYGNMVVIQHDGDFLTAYAHNSALLVRVGQRVKAGEVIARVGQSGRATAPHLHFELRKGQAPQDPLRFLPRR